MRSFLLACLASLSLAACATAESDPIEVDTDESALVCACTTDECIGEWVEQYAGCDVDVSISCANGRNIDALVVCSTVKAE
jgi:hypothetical protein